MSALLLDLTHTSHTPARTGIQRVVRALHRELGSTATSVTYDHHQGGWRTLESWELKNLAEASPGSKRGTYWPLTARWRGRIRRATGRAAKFPESGKYEGFLTAELFSAQVGAHLPHIFPRVAVFHDAIALRFPELSPNGTVARFPSYMQELLQFDGVAAVSDESRESLQSYWKWLGATKVPAVKTISLGVDPVGSDERQRVPERPLAHARSYQSSLPVVLSVGTLEGRKNHLALLDACELLWARGEKFELRVVGAVQRQTGQRALSRLRALQSAGRSLRYDGPLGDTGVDDAYAECAFTVYPSLAEGFGLPVIESLARGRPCICAGHGALGELSRGGGCVALDKLDPASIALAISRLLDSPTELAALASAASGRTFKTWRSYADELAAWVRELPRRC